MNDQIRILVVDDHPLAREGLTSILEKFPDLLVIATAASGAKAVADSQGLKPDVILMDVNLPDMSGIEAMLKIHHHSPDTKVLMLTGYSADLRVDEALQKGAMGFLMKSADASELIRAIHAAMEGKHTLSSEALKSLIHYRSNPTPSDQLLTQREMQVLMRVVRGLTNQEIGAELSISVATVKANITKVYKKLRVSSRSEAVAKAVNQRIVTLD